MSADLHSVPDPELTAVEHANLAALEAAIASGVETFVAVGNALAEVRDSKLYRAEHPTFESYCRDRWGFTDRRARQFIEAAGVAEDMAKIGTVVPVRNEAQARILANVPPERRADVWHGTARLPAGAEHDRIQATRGEMAEVKCPDCIAEGITNVRPTPHPAKRCATHHRIVTAVRRSTAHGRRVQTVYGLAPGEYEALLAAQGGVCALCRRPFVRKRGAVDHDHKIPDQRASVRGIVHGFENTILGRFGDDPVLFERVAEYLRNPPARKVLR